MEIKKIKFKTPYDDVVGEPSEAGDRYHYSVEWEKPLATLDKETGEIIQAHGDPKPILKKSYDRYELIQAALPGTDMQSIIAKSKIDPTQFILKSEMCADTTDLPIGDYNALQHYYPDIVHKSLVASEEAYNKLTDEEKALVGSKEDLYKAILSGNIDNIIADYIKSKKSEVKTEVNDNA